MNIELLEKRRKTVKIKDIIDEYDLRFGDIIYVRDNDNYYMFTLETNNSCVVNLHNGHIH